MAEAAEVVEQGAGSPIEETPSFEQFSADRKGGKVDAVKDGDKMSPGGNQWDGEKNEFVNPVARDDKGRFAKVRESLAKAKWSSEYVQAVQNGAIQPSEEMDASTWIAARNGQIRAQTQGITAPDLPPEPSPQAQGTKPAGAGPELSPEEIKGFEAHEAFMGSLAAKIAVDPETQKAMEGLGKAIERGANRDAIAYMGVLISRTDNPHEVFQALGQNPDAIKTYCSLEPQAMAMCIRSLSQQLTQAKAALQKPPKPKPPEPVGARQATTGFDVNDDNTDADTWMRERWKGVREKKRGGY